MSYICRDFKPVITTATLLAPAKYAAPKPVVAITALVTVVPVATATQYTLPEETAVSLNVNNRVIVLRVTLKDSLLINGALWSNFGGTEKIKQVFRRKDVRINILDQEILPFAHLEKEHLWVAALGQVSDLLAVESAEVLA